MLFYFLAFTGHPSKSLLHHENLHKATTKVKSNRASVNKVGVPKKVLALARLGVEVLEYPEVQGSKKKNRTNYLLGNDIALKDPLEAWFLCREYPEIINCKNIPHNPVFVPDTFFYYNNSSSSLPRQPNINGENLAKKELFHKIKSVCMEGRKNLTIFSGWKDEVIMGKRKARKFDFLIVSADARTIIHIECKNEYNENHLSQAVSQLQNGQNFFQDFFKFPRGWKYVKAAYFENRKDVPENEFILDSESDLKRFFSDHLQPSQAGADTKTYLEMVKMLIFVMFHHSKPIITSRDSALKTIKDKN